MVITFGNNAIIYIGLVIPDMRYDNMETISAPIIVKMAAETQASSGIITNIVLEIIQSPLNIALVTLIAFLIYKIIKSRQRVPVVYTPEPQLPKIRKDFTVQELKKYDGNGEDGRVLVAVNGNVYDVTRGKRFYGPGMYQ